jgi:[acyl-carrier-protein] S-malonyltransferase
MNGTTTAFVFPGQGSQHVGMGKDFAQAYPIARDTYQEADDIMGFALSALMFDGDEAELAQTVNTQPAMYVNSVAILRVLQSLKPSAVPFAVAGHSLGELTAVTASGALAFADGVALVRARARLMQRAGEASPGGMAAILNLPADVLEGVCEQARIATGKPVVIANDNCPGQIVISGDNDALEHAMTLAKEAGAKRALRLNVSTANHSPLMASAEAAFAEKVASTPFSAPNVPIYANLTAQPLHDVDGIRHELAQQLTRPVRWTTTIQNMRADGVQTFVEIGAKDVLSGLIKRTDANATLYVINSIATLEAYLAL